MELCNDTKNYVHPDIKNLMCANLTCSFVICISSEPKNNYKLIDKGDELCIILNKTNEISFHHGNKLKKHISTDKLDCNKTYHITYTRSLDGCNMIYIDSIINKITNSQKVDLRPSNDDIEFYYGDSTVYQLKKIKIYDNDLSQKQIKLIYLSDQKDKSNLLKFLSNHLYDVLEIDFGIHTHLITEDLMITLTNHHVYAKQKNYPFDTYIKYNLDTLEQLVPQLINMCVNTHSYDNTTMVHNLLTWQFGMYQSIYPKKISSIDGYWNDVSPFIPFTGKGLKMVTEKGKMISNSGTFQNGNIVSFIKIIINDYIKNKNQQSLISIEKLINYIISISENNNGVPLYYPQTSIEYESNISTRCGNFINYLRTIEIILESEQLHDYIKSYVQTLKCIHEKFLNLLLRLQLKVTINDIETLTIWSMYYDRETLQPTDGNDYEPAGLCTFESAQILLYLMNKKNPSIHIKNSINNGCLWFQQNGITGWYQMFDKKSYDPDDSDELFEQQTLLFEYNYKPFPDNMILYGRFYEFETMKPIFREKDNYFTLESFNEMNVHSRDELLIGMWGQYVLESWNEWKKIYQ